MSDISDIRFYFVALYVELLSLNIEKETSLDMADCNYET